MIPQCLQCLNKHLASALSFANEVYGGHSAGGNPDHRVDFSGEMLNAEMHANVLNKVFALKLRAFRRKLQSQRWKPAEEDLDAIRTFWFASLAVIGGKDAVDEIAKQDVELAAGVILKLAEYNTFPVVKSTSDVITDCNCKSTSKSSIGIGGDTVQKIKVYAFGITDENKKKLELNLAKFLTGFTTVEVLKKSVESWPANLPDDDETMCVFWPSNVRLIKKTDVYNLPGVVDKEHFFCKNEAKFINSSDNTTKSQKTFKLPLQVFPAVAKELCNAYLMTVGKKKFEDFYSIYRCFSFNSNFSSDCKISVNDGEEPTELTLYKIIDESIANNG